MNGTQTGTVHTRIFRADGELRVEFTAGERGFAVGELDALVYTGHRFPPEFQFVIR